MSVTRERSNIKDLFLLSEQLKEGKMEDLVGKVETVGPKVLTLRTQVC